MDHSVYVEYKPDEPIYEIAVYANRRLQSIIESNPKGFNVVQVEYNGPKQGNTFLGSIWRYLPMLDDSIDLFCATDLDNPISSFMMYLGESWLLRKHESNILFIVMDRYIPPQCIVYIGMHYRSLNAKSSTYMHCPIAQQWFWRRSPKEPSRGLDHVRTMMRMLRDADLDAYFSIDARWLFTDFKAIFRDEPSLQKLVRTIDHVKLVDIVDVTKAALKTALVKYSKDGSIPAWIRLVQKSDRLLYMLTLSVAGRLVSSTIQNKHIASVISEFTDVNVFQTLANIIVKDGYGVDEFVLNMLLNPIESSRKDLGVEVISSSSPEMGFVVDRPLQLDGTYAASPPFVRWLSSAAKLTCTNIDNLTERSIDLRIVDFIIKHAMLCELLRPTANSSRASASWYSVLYRNCKRRTSNLTTHEDPFTYLIEREKSYVMRCIRTYFKISVDAFVPWCASLGIEFDIKGYRFRYVTDDAKKMNALKDVVLRALFINWKGLTINRCIPDSKSLNRIPW